MCDWKNIVNNIRKRTIPYSSLIVITGDRERKIPTGQGQLWIEHRQLKKVLIESFSSATYIVGKEKMYRSTNYFLHWYIILWDDTFVTFFECLEFIVISIGCQLSIVSDKSNFFFNLAAFQVLSLSVFLSSFSFHVFHNHCATKISATAHL